MRWARYDAGDGAQCGIVEGDTVLQISGSPFGAYEKTGRRDKLSQVKLLPPVIPPTFYAAGFNYAQHTKEMGATTGKAKPLPTRPEIGYRAVNALTGPEAQIVIPRGSSGKVQYEGELVVVIGKQARHLSESDALSCVFGYTIGNDISERTWQASDRTLWRAKNSDTFKPMGPWIDTDVDLAKLVTTVRLNGKSVARFRTNDMIFGVAAFISAITQYITLHPGDVIWMGADAPTLDMVAGDVVEVEIDGIGTLRNPVVAEA
jgi:2-keto-4-pentenoate hydratase/2-oxohepta-3-ene-1,7-dioic acid hydratase in catechol pathway